MIAKAMSILTVAILATREKVLKKSIPTVSVFLLTLYTHLRPIEVTPTSLSRIEKLQLVSKAFDSLFLASTQHGCFLASKLLEGKGAILVARGMIETREVFMNGMSAIRGGWGVTNVILKVR